MWQKLQVSVQPTWEETHSVPRSVSGMKTVSASEPSANRNSHFTVPSVLRCSSAGTGRPIRNRPASSSRNGRASVVIGSNPVTPR